MRNPSPPRVALLYPTSVPWMAHCLDGIRRYMREHGNWHLFTSPPAAGGTAESVLTLRSLRGWKGDAIIAVTNDLGELRAARRLGIPIVNLAAGLPQSHGIPRVMVDHFLAGRLAADHLLDRGLRHLAFYGWKDLWYSQQRLLGFRERAGEAGVACDVLLHAADEEARRTWVQRKAGVAKWLGALPRPVGIFAVHDYRAQFLVEACEEAGLRIPEDVGVIGMDNDETVCEHCVPTLSSVSRSSGQVGWETAALLDRLMRGEPPPTVDLLIAPDKVVARRSTEMLYSSDPVTQLALDYMRAHMKKPFNVDHLAAHAGVSKRTLEMRFRESQQASPHEFLTRLRVRHAQTLMKESEEYGMEQLALACGFGTRKALHGAFRRITGESPDHFRKRLRNG